jgi:gamma-glutamyltranspeptidase/glutathione hydrolase
LTVRPWQFSLSGNDEEVTPALKFLQLLIGYSAGVPRSLTALGLGLIMFSAPGLASPHSPSSVHTRHGMVASDSSLASRVGARVLAQGGNAVDAACVTALALGVADPFASGLGGGGFALIYSAKTGAVDVLDFRETAPAALTPGHFRPHGKPEPSLSVRGGLAVGVPGEAAGLAEMVRRWGKRSFAACVRPAEHLAHGFPASQWLVDHVRDEFKKDPVHADDFLSQVLKRPKGPLHALAAEDRVGRPALAKTLSQLRRRGVTSFYAGEIGKAIVQAVQASGGVLDAQDLTNYSPVQRAPLQTLFQGKKIFTIPPPSAGGVILIQALGILADRLQSADLVSAGPHGPEYLHVLVEALKHGFADRSRLLGDPAFVEIPLSSLLDQQYLRELAARIRPDRTLAPEDYGMRVKTEGSPARDAGTAHLSVIDAEGNAVALTTTINLSFGAHLIAGDTGVLLNNEMDDFVLNEGQPDAFGLVGGRANLVAPGKRPLSSMTPTLVVGKSGIEVVVGAAGGPTIVSSTLQVLLDVLLFGMNVAQAEQLPRLHHQWNPDVLQSEPAFPQEILKSLRSRGHTMETRAPIGKVNMVIRDGSGLMSAPEPRSGGTPAGY